MNLSFYEKKLLLFQPITEQLFKFEFLIWIFKLALLTYLDKYLYLLTYISSYYRNSFRGYFVNFQCQAKLFDWFFAKLVIVQWQNHCRNNRHSLSFFALLIWWLVGSAGLLVGHPFDTLKVSTPPIHKLSCPKNGGLLTILRS